MSKMYKFSIYPQKSVGKYDNTALAVVYATSLLDAKSKFEYQHFVGNFMLLNNNTGQRMQVILKVSNKE